MDIGAARYTGGFGGSTRGRITLVVDGENEIALGLYRSEGFETVRTRELWSRTRLA